MDSLLFCNFHPLQSMPWFQRIIWQWIEQSYNKLRVKILHWKQIMKIWAMYFNAKILILEKQVANYNGSKRYLKCMWKMPVPRLHLKDFSPRNQKRVQIVVSVSSLVVLVQEGFGTTVKSLWLRTQHSEGYKLKVTRAFRTLFWNNNAVYGDYNTTNVLTKGASASKAKHSGTHL